MRLVLIIVITIILPFKVFSQSDRGYTPNVPSKSKGYDRKSGSAKITKPLQNDSAKHQVSVKTIELTPIDTLTQEQRLAKLELEFLKLNDYNKERKSSLIKSGILFQNAKKDRVTGLIVQFGGALIGSLFASNQKTQNAGLVIIGGTSIIGMYYQVTAWKKVGKAGEIFR
jgi:hypothetical protein